MKKYFIIKLLLIFIMLNSNICFSKEKKYDSVLEFGDSKTERVVQFTGNGDLNITGYNGDKVLISSNEMIFEDDYEADEKAKGLKKIGGGGFNIINNQKDNIVIISRPIDENIDLDIKVPNNTTLKFGSDVNKDSWGDSNFMNQILSSVYNANRKVQNDFVNNIIDKAIGGVFCGILDGDVNIKNFAGTIEVNTVDGNINAENIKGDVIASTVDGDINVTFRKLNKDSALYFSTVDGDIDMTFPKETKADIMARTMDGDVYSGFDGDVTMGNEVADDAATTESQNNFRDIFQSNYITTRINGGGHDVYLNTVDGNIYIRKGN